MNVAKVCHIHNVINSPIPEKLELFFFRNSANNNKNKIPPIPYVEDFLKGKTFWG